MLPGHLGGHGRSWTLRSYSESTPLPAAAAVLTLPGPALGAALEAKHPLAGVQPLAAEEHPKAAEVPLAAEHPLAEEHPQAEEVPLAGPGHPLAA